jgi:hypothetical protein
VSVEVDGRNSGRPTSRAKARAEREKRTVSAMVRMYCRSNHAVPKALCGDCKAICEYAIARIESCPFIEDKPTCLKCAVHCYESAQREKIRLIMRFSGPRMIYRHPVLAVRHLMDGRRGGQDIPPKR